MVARGRVYLWQGGSLWIGHGGGRAQWHAHHAHQISLPFDGPTFLRSAEGASWTEYRGAFVASDRPHELELQDVAIAQLFVEPETVEGRALARRFGDADVSSLPEPQRSEMAAMLQSAWDARVDDAEMVRAARSAIALLTAAPAAGAPLDARVAKALERIRSRIGGPVSLAVAAEAAALSPGRFRHLFVQETGAAFRSYVLWLRLQVAIEGAMAGGSWTDAAHEAGFADSAHLSRTFKRMFGMNPATLIPDRDRRDAAGILRTPSGPARQR
jgi:AraC-like DNA-binding protein